jgi:hypothetical protein
MSKDLTASRIDRQNILNNEIAVEEIQTKSGVEGILWEGKIYITREMTANFFEVDIRTIGRYIEQNIELPLEIINVPRGKELLPFASSVKVVYRQLLDSHKPLDMSDFRCVLDYKDIESSINSQAVPRLEKAPQGIYSVSFDPPYVDCIVLDKQ